MANRVRIGIIGAGAFTVGRMLPNLVKLASAEVVAIANRSQESGEAVAEKFGIPRVETDYRQILASPEVDAVFIGTPPYLHQDATLAALESGKHVLCQTRISTSVAEARAMLAAADAARSRGLRTMLVPPAPFYRGSRFVAHLIESGFLGQLRHVLSFNMNASFADPNTPLSVGRSEMALYGQFNAMQLGLSYDVLCRWTGRATSVIAQRASFVPRRPLTPNGPMVDNPYPDEVTVISNTTSGAVTQNLLNYSAYFADPRVELYGSDGTVVYHQRGDVIVGARAGEDELTPRAIPAEHDQPWQVEEEFVRLVRGEVDEPSFTFADGVANMAYLEAAYYAATEGRRVEVE